MSVGSAQKSIAAVLAAAVLVAVFAGCGGDTRRGEESSTGAAAPAAPAEPAGSEKPAGEPRPTRISDPVRRAYVARVDAVCGRFDPERSGSQKRVAEARDAGEAARAYDETIALGWRELGRIEAIPVPPGDAAALRANVFDPIRHQLALRRRIAAALAAVDLPRLRALRAQLDDTSRALTGFARGYGFRVCGEE